MENNNGIQFSPPKKKRETPVIDPHSVYLKTLISQNDEIIRILKLLVKDA